MTSTQLATWTGVGLGAAFTYVMYTTVPAYHSMLVWSWGLFGINLESLLG